MYGLYTEMVMNDIGWLMVDRLHKDEVVVKPRQEVEEIVAGRKRKRPPEEDEPVVAPRPRVR